MIIREMLLSDHQSLIKLFRDTPGITVREADSLEATEKYLERNPGLNFIATEGEELVGCVMCGHDGRRGYLQHLVVREEFRSNGLGQNLYSRCIESLSSIGIEKTHIFVFKTNKLANEFWSKRGWQLREDLNMYSFNVSSDPNA
ncbi:MAG: GNAT family N-acetyltransferase [Neptuniibacter sp.]